MSTLLRLSCPDRVGLLALISNFVAQHGGNLIEVHQYTDPAAGWFFTRMEIDTRTLVVELPALRQEFAPIAAELQAEWTIRTAEAQKVRCQEQQARHVRSFERACKAAQQSVSTAALDKRVQDRYIGVIEQTP